MPVVCCVQTWRRTTAIQESLCVSGMNLDSERGRTEARRTIELAVAKKSSSLAGVGSATYGRARSGLRLSDMVSDVADEREVVVAVLSRPMIRY